MAKFNSKILPLLGGAGSEKALGIGSTTRVRGLRVGLSSLPRETPLTSRSLTPTVRATFKGLPRTRKCCAPPAVVQNGTTPWRLDVSVKPVVVTMKEELEVFR